MNRFYLSTPNILALGKSIQLSDSIFHHWCKVLRAKIGDKAVLFDGMGGEYRCTLIETNKKTAYVSVDAFDAINRTNAYHTTLVQAISRGERMDYTIQKAVELGVSCIQLVVSDRSDRLRYERDQKKLDHWQAVAVSACEQCGMNVIPNILPPIALADYVSNCQDTLKLVMSPPSDHHCFLPTTPLPQRISLVVGAEGGLSEDEIALCHRFGFLSWTIGERVLRTETAGVVALAALAVIHAMN